MDPPRQLDDVLLPDLILPEDLARRMGRSPRTIRALLRAGKLPGVKIAGRWVIERGELLQFLRSRRRPLHLLKNEEDADAS